MLINKEKLDAIMKKRGYSSYYEIEDAAKERDINLSYRTIYNVAANRNWTRDTLVSLCDVLNCQVEDIVEMETPQNHTQDDPQPGKVEPEQVPG